MQNYDSLFCYNRVIMNFRDVITLLQISYNLFASQIFNMEAIYVYFIIFIINGFFIINDEGNLRVLIERVVDTITMEKRRLRLFILVVYCNKHSVSFGTVNTVTGLGFEKQFG